MNLIKEFKSQHLKYKLCRYLSINFDRFGYVSNELIRGHAIRGWNYMVLRSNNPFDHYCNSTTNFADCFERTRVMGSGTTIETGIDELFEIHGNYWQGYYNPAYTCGNSENGNVVEHARGVVCQ